MMKWHYRMALTGAVAVIIWGCSGLLHPLMTWTNPRAAAFMPPAAESFAIPPHEQVRGILRTHDITQFTALRIGASWIQVSVPDSAERLYFSLPDGQPIADGDRLHAVALARYYSGLTDAAVADATLVTAFSNRYTYINRYLPVWQVTFDDPRGLSVYVDTATDRLGAITDTHKVILQGLFQTLHTGQWLEGAEALRLALIAALVGSALSVAVAGLYLLVRLRGKRKGLRRAHRALGYAALVPLLMFPVSGLFHLFVQSPLLYKERAAVSGPVEAAALDRLPQGRADDVRLVQPSWWRVQNGRAVSYIPVSGGQMLEGDEAYVRQMAGEGIRDVSLVTSFSDEYGFAYKRLPVWRVEQGDRLLFIEARTGIVAADVDRLKVAETWTFSRLHKWQFLDGVSAKISGPGPFKTAFRDAVMVVFVLAGLGMAVIGLRLRRRKLTSPLS